MNQATNVNIVPSYGQRGDLHFSQYDVGRTATINLYAVNEAYTIPLSATVKIQATKPSGLGFDVACTFSGSVVTVVSTETMTAEAGRFPAELHIIDNSDVIGTANFMFVVEASPHPDGVIDGDAEEVVNEIKALVLQSEGYALGTQDGVDVGNESPYYHNNSKYWAEHPAGGGLSDDVKQALLSCFQNVAWINDDGQDYYDALQTALYPPAEVVSISAVYTQSGDVYDTDTLNSLKSDLVVTATYDDTTTEEVIDYTLSGTLTVGTSTITVTYENKTDTFSVTVTQDPSQVETVVTLTNGTDWNYSNGLLTLADGTVDTSSTSWYTSDYVEIPANSTSFSRVTSRTSDNYLVWYDSSKTYVGNGLNGTYSGNGQYGGGFTDSNSVVWNVIPSTAKYCRVSWRTSATFTSLSFKHNVKIDANTTPVYNKVYYYTYDPTSTGSYIYCGDYLKCGGMAYAQIRPIRRRAVKFYDGDLIQVGSVAQANNVGNNISIPNDAVYLKCENANDYSGSNPTIVGQRLIEFTETSVSEW